MSESLEAQIKDFASRLGHLIRRGHQVRDALAKDSSNPSAVVAARAWQEECGVAVNQLSGNSKAHWLARSFSEAFLMRSASGNATVGAAPQEDRPALARRPRASGHCALLERAADR